MTSPDGHEQRDARPSGEEFPVRVRDVLRVRAVWIFPAVLASVLVVLMTVFYIGSVVNPLAHLHGLPVAVANQDRGVTLGTRHLNIGQQVQTGLAGSRVLSDKVHLDNTSLPAAEQAMDRGKLYATVVIPPDFTASLLSVSGLPVPAGAGARPQIEILTNPRAGTLGTSLASGVLQPGLAVASKQIGQQLSALVPAGASNAATRALLTDPVTVTINQYRPPPPGSALGLSAFYIALLTLICGFLGATIVNASADAALGYATTEIGPRWSQRQPLPISRWRTLLIKWAMMVPLSGLLTGLMLLIAVYALQMDAPHTGLLWLYSWLCAASVGIGTIVLFAVLGTPGQLVGLLVFVYLGLASAGGTVPLQALPTVLRWVSQVEPLRQVLDGTRSILFFDARADAGLARGTIAAGVGLLLWLIIGSVIVRWYDRRSFHRIQPELLAYIGTAVKGYQRPTAPASD